MVYDWFNRGSVPPKDSAESSVDQSASRDQPAATDPSSTHPAAEVLADSESPQSQEDDPLEWARQAYARLKAQKVQAAADETQPIAEQSAVGAEPISPTVIRPPAEHEQPQQETIQSDHPSESVEPVAPPFPVPSPPDPAVEIVSPPIPAVSPPPESEPEPSPALSFLEQAVAQRDQRQQALEQPADSEPAQEPDRTDAVQHDPQADSIHADEPSLGEFDDAFTWSAEVLAAQGRRAEQVSLEEIDWLGRLRQGLEKTRQGFVTGLLQNLGDDPLTPEVLEDLESLLLRADAGVQATDRVLDALRQRMNQQVVDPSEGIRFLKEQLRDLLEEPIKTSGVDVLGPHKERLNVWLLVGVNGVGKTTTLGKLANLAVRSGYSALIAAADTFRAAAVQQVQVWGDRSDVPVVANPSANADPAAVVFDAIGAARSKGTNLVLVDTAGRLQTKHNLMEELEKIRRVVDRLAPDAHVESLLVLDASQGQNGLKQAMAFARAAGLTGVVITKLDGTARGGVALAVASEAKLPIRFIGAGEGIRDLRPFNSFEFVEALLASR